MCRQARIPWFKECQNLARFLWHSVINENNKIRINICSGRGGAGSCLKSLQYKVELAKSENPRSGSYHLISIWQNQIQSIEEVARNQWNGLHYHSNILPETDRLVFVESVILNNHLRLVSRLQNMYWANRERMIDWSLNYTVGYASLLFQSVISSLLLKQLPIPHKLQKLRQ